MRKSKFRAIVLSLALAAASTQPSRTRAQVTKTYDGHWWLAASQDEQEGFLDGYADCYVNDYRGAENYWATSSSSQSAITEFYKRHPLERALLVSQAFLKLPPRTPKKPLPGGEVWTDRHGYYDGQYWGGLGDEGELGYIEGYLWCWKTRMHNKGATFSKSPEEYVRLINGWYELTNAGDINAKREPAKIADVLYRFRDQATRSAPPPAKPGTQ